LWVTDLTFVPTWAGVAYVCFIIDAFSRMIVGWRVAPHMRTEMVLDAIEMARWSRGHHHGDLRCHSDAGSQFTSIRYGERLAEIGATPVDRNRRRLVRQRSGRGDQMPTSAFDGLCRRVDYADRDHVCPCRNWLGRGVVGIIAA